MLGTLIGFGLICWLAIYNTEWIIQEDGNNLNNEIIAIAGLLAIEAFLLISEFINLTKASMLESYLG